MLKYFNYHLNGPLLHRMLWIHCSSEAIKGVFTIVAGDWLQAQRPCKSCSRVLSQGRHTVPCPWGLLGRLFVRIHRRWFHANHQTALWSTCMRDILLWRTPSRCLPLSRTSSKESDYLLERMIFATILTVWSSDLDQYLAFRRLGCMVT